MHIDDMTESPDLTHEPLEGEDGLDESQSRISELEAEVASWKETAARERADALNMKARCDREVSRSRALGSSRAVLALLPVLDNLDLALASEGDLRDGVRIIRDQFSTALQGLGVEEVTGEGSDFTPAEHDAMGMVPVTEKEMDGKIVHVIQKGYKLAGSVIRPARVQVGQFVAQDNENN